MYAYVDSSTNNLGQTAAGYDGNGIIIFSYTDNEFYAYDRTCPYDYEVNQKSVKVNVVDDIYAVCPSCGTEYALFANGTPAKGIGRYPLKNYRAAFDGTTNIFVSNY
jgi:nitrite reductase/ring-hydroxylating ferredoxin subunit